MNPRTMTKLSLSLRVGRALSYLIAFRTRDRESQVLWNFVLYLLSGNVETEGSSRRGDRSCNKRVSVSLHRESY